jgi:1-acyl-sn-glycerol-3-phosphate acyltransferase
LIRAVLVLLWLSLFIPPATVVGVLATFVSRSPRPIYVLARICVWVGLKLAGVRVRVSGLEHLAEWRNTVLMANHESLLDPAVLLHALPVDIKVLVKQELFKVPFLGTAMLGAGLIPVDRANRERARVSIERAVQALRAGACFLVFPEGTRSRTGELGPFKKGVFLASMEAGSRIVPVALRGTRPLLPKGHFSISPGEVRVELLPPLAADPSGDRDQLIEDVRGRIAAALAS